MCCERRMAPVNPVLDKLSGPPWSLAEVADVIETHIGPKVGDRALQRLGAASVMDLGTSRKRTNPLGSLAILRLVYRNVAKGGVPAQFFLPSLQTPPSWPISCEVFST